MNIYVGHPSSIGFKEQLYQPLRNSKLDGEHNIVLPHEDSDEPFNSKEFLKNDCDIFIAEVSEASTGLGIELGWADLYDVPVICIHRESSDPSSSLSAVTDIIVSYEGDKELVKSLSELIEEI